MGAKEEVSRGPSGGRVKFLARLLLVVCTACTFPGGVLSQVLSQEYQLKAKYLGKIPSFVEWPRAPRIPTRRLFKCAHGVSTGSVRDSRKRLGASPLAGEGSNCAGFTMRRNWMDAR